MAGSIFLPSLLKASEMKLQPQKPTIKNQHGALQKAYSAISIVEPYAPDMKFEVEMSENLDELYVFVGVKGVSVKMRHFQKLIFTMNDIYTNDNIEQMMAERLWKSVQVLRGHKV